MYDLSLLHDPSINYNGITPYRSVEYVSVYDGITVEMHIVDHCNLNCAGCNHFSPLATPWEIDLEYFEKQLIALRDNIPTVKRLILLGGEPTLHSNFKEICLKAREIFPNIIIDVLSNGVNLSNVEKNIESLRSANINITFCSYLGYTDFEKINELKLHYFNSRSLMHQTLVDESGQQDKEFNFFHCGNYTLPCFTLKDFKLYICPFSAHFALYSQKSGFIYNEQENIDYLDVRKVKNNMDIIQDFCFTPKDYCQYCKQTNATWIWQKSSRDAFEFNTELQDMYLKDYPRYEKITNSNFQYFLDCYTEKNPARIDYQYAANIQENLLLRLGLGKMDIIIPHYNTDIRLIDRLVKSLLSQTIIQDCTVYFVSDCSPNDKEFLNYIKNQPLNYVLLKTPERGGPGAARNYAIDFSFNKYILFFDSDDYFVKDTALEELYLKMEEGYDALTFIMHNYKNNKANPLARRSFLIDKGIQYLPIYFGEDENFIKDLKQNSNNVFNYGNTENIFGYYDIDNNASLTNTFAKEDAYHLNLITSFFKIFKAKQEEARDIRNFYNFVKTNRKLSTDDFTKTYVYYILYIIYKNNPKLYCEICEDDFRTIDYMNDSLYITLSDRVLQTEEDILDFLKDKLLQITNPYLEPAAKIALTLLS